MRSTTIDKSQRNIGELIDQYRVHLPLLPQISCVTELTHYFNETRVSWFNYEPVHCLAQCLSQEVVCSWNQYGSVFQQRCSQRRLREYDGIPFCESSEHIFVLEIDESVDQMMVSQIPRLCSCLCRILSCPAVYLHLVQEQKDHLALWFCYCYEDYLKTFHALIPEQLVDLKEFRVVRLKDRKNSFNFEVAGELFYINYIYPSVYLSLLATYIHHSHDCNYIPIYLTICVLL